MILTSSRKKSLWRDQINCETTAWSLPASFSFMRDFNKIFSRVGTRLAYWHRLFIILKRRKQEISLNSLSLCAAWKGRERYSELSRRKLEKFEAGWRKLKSYQNEIVFSRLWESIRRLVGNLVDSKLDLKIAAVECGENNEARGANDTLTHSTMNLVYFNFAVAWLILTSEIWYRSQ